MSGIAEFIVHALAVGVITKGNGGLLTFGEHKLGQGEDKAAAILAEKPELVEQIKAAIDAKGNVDKAKPKVKVSAKSNKNERRAFKVTSQVLRDGDIIALGKPIDLTEAEHAEFKAGGVIDAVWDDGAPVDD